MSDYSNTRSFYHMEAIDDNSFEEALDKCFRDWIALIYKAKSMATGQRESHQIIDRPSHHTLDHPIKTNTQINFFKYNGNVLLWYSSWTWSFVNIYERAIWKCLKLILFLICLKRFSTNLAEILMGDVILLFAHR